ERQYENTIKEKERLNKAIEKQASKADKMSKGQKSQDIKPDRLSSSKQKDTVQKQAHKTAKAMESRLNQLADAKRPDQQADIEFPVSKAMELHISFRSWEEMSQ